MMQKSAGKTEGGIRGRLEKFKEAIWHRRPILGEIMKRHGEQNLYDYSEDFMDVNPSPRLDARKPELIAVVKELIAKRLGASIAEQVARQLSKLSLVSTTDHHGPIQHPFFLNANLISALPYTDHDDSDLNHLVVFSFASVSVNNPSAYTRGILFHGGMNGSENLIRLPILPDKLKMSVVYGTRGYTRDDLNRAEEQLREKEKNGEIAEGRGDAIRDFLEENFGTEDILSAPDLNAQCTKINYKLWPKLFHPAKGERAEPYRKLPDLLYVEIETLVTELLLKHHLHKTSSLIHKFIFSKELQPLVLKYFNNIPGAFSQEKGWGTYLFWALDERSHRVRLDVHDGSLISRRDESKIPLTPEAIAQALREKKIFPGMLLCYLLVSLYYGMKCLGGFCQVHDLTMTKKAWSNLLNEIGETGEVQALVPVQTRELGGDGMVLAYLRTVKGEMVPATGVDMALDEKDTTYRKYVERSKTVKMQEMMNPILPEMYTVLYPIDDRDPMLMTVSPEQILRETGLQEKLVLSSVKNAVLSHEKAP